MKTKLTKLQRKRLEKASNELRDALLDAIIPALKKAADDIKKSQEENTSGK